MNLKKIHLFIYIFMHTCLPYNSIRLNIPDYLPPWFNANVTAHFNKGTLKFYLRQHETHEFHESIIWPDGTEELNPQEFEVKFTMNNQEYQGKFPARINHEYIIELPSDLDSCGLGQHAITDLPGAQKICVQTNPRYSFLTQEHEIVEGI